MYARFPIVEPSKLEHKNNCLNQNHSDPISKICVYIILTPLHHFIYTVFNNETLLSFYAKIKRQSSKNKRDQEVAQILSHTWLFITTLNTL